MHLLAIHLMNVCCILKTGFFCNRQSHQFDELALCKLICLPFQNTCGKVLESRLTTFARFTLFLRRGRILVVKRFQTDDFDADGDDDDGDADADGDGDGDGDGNIMEQVMLKSPSSLLSWSFPSWTIT